MPTQHISRSKDGPLGTVITFYSFKGGVGRSMALANLAVLLARAGKRVLCIDWDLEAPGLDRYFRAVPRADTAHSPRMAAPAESGGLLCILEESTVARIAPWRAYVQTRTGFDGSTVDFICSGDDAGDYSSRLSNFTWAEYFAKRQGGQIIELLRNEWKATYDYVLVDSRTGLTDASGICSIQMPDLLVMLFAANEQSREWSFRVAQSIRTARRALPFDRSFLTIIPLLARFDAREESDRAAEAMDRIASAFEPLFADWLPRSIRARDMLAWSALPYIPRYSFEEALAVEDEPETGAQGLVFYYQLLSKLILARFQNVRQILAGVGVPGAALAPLIPSVSELREELRQDARAFDRYRNAILERADEEPMEAADALETLASVLSTTSQLAEAEEIYKRAIAIYADPRVGKPSEARRVQELSAQILARARLAPDAAAAATLERDLDLLVMQGDTAGQAAALNHLGGVLQRLGRLDEASEALQRSHDLFAQHRNRSGQADALHSLGLVLQRLGRFEEAIDAFQRCYDLVAERGDSRAQIKALRSLAFVQQRVGRFVDAADSLQRSLDLSAEVEDVRGQVQTLHALGVVLQRLGRFQDSVDALDRSKLIAEVMGDQRSLSMVLNSLGGALQRMGKFQEAVDALDRSRMIAEELGDQRSLSMTLNSLGGVLQRMGRFQEAADALERSRKIAEELGDQRSLAMVLNSLGGVLQRLGKFGEAHRAFEESIEIGMRLNDTLHLAKARTAFGKALLARDLLDLGVEQLRQGFLLDERAQNKRGIRVVTPILIYALRRLEYQDEARDLLSRALKIAGDDPEIQRLAMSDSQFESGVTSQAVPISGRIKRLLEPLGRPKIGFIEDGDKADIYFSEERLGREIYSSLSVNDPVEADVIFTSRGREAIVIRRSTNVSG